MPTAQRHTQLDGWRALAVAGVMWLHWAPREWRGPFPFEIGLFFFLTLTGFLITRILLWERARGEVGTASWKWQAYVGFAKRRMLRILLPCYAAMVFAMLLGAHDIREHAVAYFGHFSNFHMALMRNWPGGSAPFWTLAIQVQFYLCWPLLVFFAPRRWLVSLFVACVAIAPLSRRTCEHLFPCVYHSEAITSSAMDYFGVGALLAWAMDRGMPVGDKRFTWIAWFAFVAYATLYSLNEMGRQVAGLHYLQQTCIAVAFAGLISSTLAGFGGRLGRFLDHPAIQHIGRLSFGLYLFHSAAPLLLGHIIPQLWSPFFHGPWLLMRLFAFALTSWGLAWLCWRYLENGKRSTPAHRSRE
jgi:peptidoglycan/LPS O-acetylase OafA/YrhL